MINNYMKEQGIEKQYKHKHLLRAILAPFVFELCGVFPLILVSLGFLGVNAGIALRTMLVYKYGTIFLIIAAYFFFYSIYQYLRQQNSCNLEGVKKNYSSILIALLILSALEAFLLFILEKTETLIYGHPETKFNDFSTIFPVLLLIIVSFLVFILISKISHSISIKR